MRSILEQAVIHHLNGDSEKATDLFHQFIVARARQVHESMRNGEDPLAEDWENQFTEEYFNETELDELEDLEGEDVDSDFGADDALDVAADDTKDALDAAEELGDDLGVDAEEIGDDEESISADLDDADELEDRIEDQEARLEDLEAELERLIAQFDEEQGENDFDDGAEIEDDMSDDADMTTEDDDDDFEGLGESALSELEKVTVSTVDGGKISTNTKSGLPQKGSAARQGGKPIDLKSSNHKGFDREAAPAVASMKARKNTSAKAEMKPVSAKDVQK